MHFFYYYLHILPIILFISEIQSAAEVFEEIKEYFMYSYNISRYFIIYPVCERLYRSHYKMIPLLPDPSILHHYDAFGNLLESPREILKEDDSCNRVSNYTETFKTFHDHLSVIKQPTFTRIDFSSLDLDHILCPQARDFSDEEIEESADYWEEKYLKNRGDAFEDDREIDISRLPKTFKTFPLIEIPLQSRFAMILEVYLIDLMKSFYPLIEGARVTKFDDLLGILLFYFYFNLERESSVLYEVYLNDILKDLKSIGTRLKLPTLISKSNCFELLFDDSLKLNLFFTFYLFQSTGFLKDLMNISHSKLVKRILKSNQEELIKFYLNSCDRNCEISGIGTEYSGKLCHLIYWIGMDWLFLELLKYKDVYWDEPDCRGYTVLGYMVHDHTLDERYRQFLKKTKMFVACFDGGFQRNIIEECMISSDRMRGLSKFVTYLTERHTSDDFGPLLLSAALQDRMEYFNRLLEYRKTNCCHEMDSAFQLILALDKRRLNKYLVRIMANLQECHGVKGNRLEHVFFSKWEFQLAKWQAAAKGI